MSASSAPPTRISTSSSPRAASARISIYRLNEVKLNIPPLRERDGDVLLLASYFLKKFNEQYGRSLKGFATESLAAMRRHPWRGNVRELENRVKRAVVMSEGPLVTAADLDLASSGGRGALARPAERPQPRRARGAAARADAERRQSFDRREAPGHQPADALQPGQGARARDRVLSAAECRAPHDEGTKHAATFRRTPHRARRRPRRRRAARAHRASRAATDDAHAGIAAAQKLINQGDLRGAEIELRNAVRANSSDPTVHVELAQVYLELGNLPAAEAEARTARRGWRATKTRWRRS